MLKESTLIVLVWSQLGSEICHKIIELREGKDGVNKGGSRLINAHECFVRAFISCKGDGMEGETLLLVREVLILD